MKRWKIILMLLFLAGCIEVVVPIPDDICSQWVYIPADSIQTPVGWYVTQPDSIQINLCKP